MSCHALRNPHGKITAIITFPDIYQFKGFTFQVHYYCGPMKLKKDGSESARTGRKFWKAWSEWDKLSKEEKEATRI